jgi:CTP:molybdopterin cytidylyltransferase MocA
MGSPKALLKIENRMFLARVLDTYCSVGIPTYVVLGTHATLVENHVDLSSATVLKNPEPSRGPLSSLLIALQESSDSAAFILHPVDHPMVSVNTIRRLIEGYYRVPHCILIPSYRGRRGHPVLIPSRFYPDLRSAPLSEGARWVVRANRAANHLLAVDDPGILVNIDTKQDYCQLAGFPRLDRP